MSGYYRIIAPKYCFILSQKLPTSKIIPCDACIRRASCQLMLSTLGPRGHFLFILSSVFFQGLLSVPVVRRIVFHFSSFHGAITRLVEDNVGTVESGGYC